MSKFVGGRYQIIARLGGGGMANVFLAKLTGKADFAKLAVVKRLKPLEEDAGPEFLEMFAEEARLSARLNHPHIVQTFEVGEDTEGPFLVMEYIEGQSVSRIRARAARRGTTIPRSISLKMIRDTLSALAYAHALRDHDGSALHVIHRDVSPENIMITYEGITKLVDFGVAKAYGSMNQTRAGVIKGKVSYMAPEQARLDGGLDGRADVFSAGLLLWELLTHQRMWMGLTELEVLQHLVSDAPLPRARSVDATVPEDLDAICARALEKDSSKRFTSANDFLDALESASDQPEFRTSLREAGRLVGSLFESDREKVAALVSGSVKRHQDVPSGGSPIPRFDEGLSGRPSSAPSSESDPSPWRMLYTPTFTSSPSLSQGPPTARGETAMGTAESIHAVEPPRRSTNPLIIAIVIGPLAAIAAGLVIRMIAGPSSTAPRPTATAASAPVLTRPVATDLVTYASIYITVHPASARIRLDGKPVGGSPFQRTGAREETTHEMRIEADGYEPRTFMLTFDRDHSLDVTLAKTSAPPPPPPPPPPVAVRGWQPTPPRPAPQVPKPAAPPSEPTAEPAAAPAPREIGEIDPQKHKTPKQDKIDTDILKR